MTSDVFAEDFLPYNKDGMAGPLPLFQHRTNEYLFSTDGGDTFYDLTEELDVTGNPVIHDTHKEHSDA